MPKNKGKGGKNRRRGKNENDSVKRELILKEEGQAYAQVTRILGNGHLEAFCFDNAGGKKRLCHIRGKLRKKQWINQGDVILVGLRDYQDDKADVIMRYLADEARELKRMREIPENINIADPTPNNEVSDDIVFDDHYNGDSDDEENGVPRNTNGRSGDTGSISEEESIDDDDDEAIEFNNPNRMPKNTGNLNAHNLLGVRKETSKGARNDRRQVIADSDPYDDLANI